MARSRQQAEAEFFAERESRYPSKCDGWCGHPWCSAVHDRVEEYVTREDSKYLIPDSFEQALLDFIGARRMTPEESEAYHAQLAQELVDRAMGSYAYS